MNKFDIDIDISIYIYLFIFVSVALFFGTSKIVMIVKFCLVVLAPLKLTDRPILWGRNWAV